MGEHQSKNRNHILYELVAISGDCSATGMGDTASRLPVRNKHLIVVAEFLRVDLELTIQSATKRGKLPDKALFEHFWALSGALLDLDIFKHKWHARTSWFLQELSEEYESLPAYIKASNPLD
jgi:hypothetical protein